MRRDSWSFSYSPAEARSRGFGYETVEVVSLDSFFLRNPPANSPEMVKIDAEGWDLEVLRGAKKTLSQTNIVFVEAGVLNKRFENSVAGVLSFMTESGFELVDITDLNRTRDLSALWLVELAFARKDFSFLRQVGVHS